MTLLTAPLLALLKTEITADPAGRGYSGQKADLTAELMNSPFTTEVPAGPMVLRDIATSAVDKITIPSGEMFAIQTLSTKPLSGLTPPAGLDLLIAAAWSFTKMVDRWATIETSNAGIWAACQAGMAALQAAGVLSPASIAAIKALVEVVPNLGVTHSHARVLDVFMGVEGAPNAVSADDVEGALAW